MSGESKQFQNAIQKFDAANAQDPTRVGGVPAEVLYARRMTDWLNRLYPEADEILRLAVRRNTFAGG